MFFVLIFFLGIGGANFALYTLWLPEQYSTNCRASAIAFVSSVGRFVGVAMVFLVGSAIQSYGSLGSPRRDDGGGLCARDCLCCPLPKRHAASAARRRSESSKLKVGK